MKRMKMALKEMPKRTVILTMIFAMLFSYALSITNVFATNYGEGTKSISVGIDNNSDFSVSNVTVNNSAWANGQDLYFTTDDKYDVVVNVSNTGEKVPDVVYGGNWNKFATKSYSLNNNVYTYTIKIDLSKATDEERSGLNQLMLSVEERNQNQGGDSGEIGDEHGHENFDGKAYLIWSCSDGSVCYQHFDDIPNFDNGNSTFYKASDIKDTRTGESFNVDAQYKGWSTDDKFNDWVEAYKTYKKVEIIDWSKVKPEEIIGDPIDMREYEEQAISAGKCTRENTEREAFEKCVDGYVAELGVWNVIAKLQPLPDEPTDNNAYVSYGDRNFKVVVYNDQYKGVTLGSLSSLSYYPAYYTNPFIRQDQFDLSDTSKNNPTVIDSILLENTVTIKTLSQYNSFDIKSIEALDVPSDAVNISKENGEWKIVFTSNFYDNVVFKATDTNGGVEYFKIHRYTLDASLRFVDNKPVISAGFYFNRNKSYTDFIVTAKIVYKNGETKKVNMEASFGVDDGLGNVTPAYEVDEEDSEYNKGKGVKKSTFEYSLSQGEEETIQKVYINVEHKGSTDTNYAGAFTGSGKGVELSFGEGR